MQLALRTFGHEHHACPRGAAVGAPLLAPGEHLTLLLAACGYSPTEIADERGLAVGDVVADLRRAVDRLGAATVHGAIAAAAERGLLARSTGGAAPENASAA